MEVKELIFRAKEANSNEWVYGDLINGINCRLIGFIFITPPTMQDTCGDSIYRQEPIKDSTIGVFTGYYDKNKNKIFTGDILSFTTTSAHMVSGKKVNLPPVEFGELCVQNNTLYDFIGFHINNGSIKYKLSFDCEIVGNKFDNPELSNPLQ